MYQTLFYIPDRIAGLPLFGFGWGLILWGIIAAVILLVNVRRHGWSNDTWSIAFLLGAIGAAIVYLVPNLLDSGGKGLPIRGFGVMMLLGVVCGVGLAIHRARQMGVDPEVIFSLSFWMFLFGILGARLFFVIEYRENFRRDTLLATLQAMVNVPEGGIVLYGAFFGGLAAALVFFAVRKLPALALADIIVPGMVIGASLGRVGCFLNGCCFGGLCESNLPKVEFPVNSPPYHYQLSHGWLHGLKLGEDEGHVGIVAVSPGSPAEEAGLQKDQEIVAINGQPVAGLADAEQRIAAAVIAAIELADRSTHTISFKPPPRSLPIHPAQLYDAINLALMTLVLWLYYPLRRHDGELLAVGMMLYSITRFVIEIIRVDEPGQLNTGFSISQLLSFGIFLAGAVLLTYIELRNRPLSLPWHGAPVAKAA